MLEYRVEGRNGYYALDFYIDGAMIQTIETFRTRKQATLIACEMNALATTVNKQRKQLNHPWVKAMLEKIDD